MLSTLPIRSDKKSRTDNLHKLSVTTLILLLSVSMPSDDADQ